MTAQILITIPAHQFSLVAFNHKPYYITIKIRASHYPQLLLPPSIRLPRPNRRLQQSLTLQKNPRSIILPLTHFLLLHPSRRPLLNIFPLPPSLHHLHPHLHPPHSLRTHYCQPCPPLRESIPVFLHHPHLIYLNFRAPVLPPIRNP